LCVETNRGFGLELTEANDVKAIFTSYRAMVESPNRNAQMIMLFAWKVSESHASKTRVGVPSGAVVKSGTTRFTIPDMNPETGGLKAAIQGPD
jgi:hypothetical protein